MRLVDAEIFTFMSRRQVGRQQGQLVLSTSPQPVQKKAIIGPVWFTLSSPVSTGGLRNLRERPDYAAALLPASTVGAIDLDKIVLAPAAKPQRSRPRFREILQSIPPLGLAMPDTFR